MSSLPTVPPSFPEGDGELLEEADVYKATTSSDLVVKRRLRLYKAKFVTFHDFERDPESQKQWYFDGKCELVPKSAGEIKDAYVKMVRPQGTWTITAMMKNKGQQVSLYLFTVTWPTRWAAKGYTAFTLGFTTPEEARHWYNRISECLTQYRQAPRRVSRGHSPKVSLLDGFSSVLGLTHEYLTQPPISATSDVTPPQEKEKEDTASVSASDQGVKFDGLPPETCGTTTSLSDSDEEHDMPCAPSARSITRANVQHIRQRWVPFKQINGVAIYHHKNNRDEDSGVGGEYMVSAAVRGSPRDCLKVLMCNSGNTTILGPAKKLEVLEKRRPDTQKEVLRIVLQAGGVPAMLCAPREVVVETVMRTDESGPTFVLMFNSCEVPARTHEYGFENGKVDDEPAAEVYQAQDAGRYVSWYKNAVSAKVQGGYTIAPLEDHSLETSPESLVTCIIKVDLGGVCGERSWMKMAADVMGWTDAFLDRILMSVILLRDEVEHRRFAVQPLSLVASAAPKDVQRSASVETMSRCEALTELRQTLNRFSGRVTANDVKHQEGQAGAYSAHPAAVRFVPGVIPEDGHPAAAPLPGEPQINLDAIAKLCTLDHSMWGNTHQPGKDAPFKVRGPTYLKDRKKIPAGQSKYVLAALDLIEVPELTEHVARFMPSIRENGAPFSFVIHLIIPGTPMLGIVATFVSEHHPADLPTPPKHPMEDDHDWEPFDFVLHKYMNSDDKTRNLMLKLIPHIADGSWIIKNSVGTTPVILGKQLKTTYYQTPQYFEIDIDISCNSVAAYVTGLVRGCTKSLVIDMGFVLEGTAPWELPEALLGTIRLHHLDVGAAKLIDVKNELPLRPVPRKVSSKGNSRKQSVAGGLDTSAVPDSGSPKHSPRHSTDRVFGQAPVLSSNLGPFGHQPNQPPLATTTSHPLPGTSSQSFAAATIHNLATTHSANPASANSYTLAAASSYKNLMARLDRSTSNAGREAAAATAATSSANGAAQDS